MMTQNSPGSGEEARTGVRRSTRLAVSLPIRVYAIDFKGVDFIEDSTTVVVNYNGAKIRLTHQLIPDQEIRIQSVKTSTEAIFRVVSRVGNLEDRFTYWGVECLTPSDSVWGMNFPEPGPDDQRSVRALLRCPICRSREVLHLDEPLLESIQELGGLLRGCLKCGQTGIWEQVPYTED
jgi:hypothetical protein